MKLGTWRSFGWPAGLALVLTGAAIAGALWLSREEARLEARRAALQERRHDIQRSSATPTAVLAANAFAASLPPDSERQSRTTALLALSAEAGLPWPRTEFRYQADTDGGLAQYRIAMSVTGRYAALRHYVEEALRRDPALGLESLRLRRETGGALKAELSWVLHMQAAR